MQCRHPQKIGPPDATSGRRTSTFALDIYEILCQYWFVELLTTVTTARTPMVMPWVGADTRNVSCDGSIPSITSTKKMPRVREEESRYAHNAKTLGANPRLATTPNPTPAPRHRVDAIGIPAGARTGKIAFAVTTEPDQFSRVA